MDAYNMLTNREESDIYLGKEFFALQMLLEKNAFLRWICCFCYYRRSINKVGIIVAGDITGGNKLWLKRKYTPSQIYLKIGQQYLTLIYAMDVICV